MLIYVMRSVICVLVVFLTSPLSYAQKEGNQEIFFFPREDGPPCTTFDGQPGKCSLLAQCTQFFANIAELSRSPCSINEDQMGVCCPPRKQPSRNPIQFVTDDLREIRLPQVDTPSKNNAVKKGIEQSRKKQEIEFDLEERRIIVLPDSPAFFHAKLFETTDKIIEQSRGGDVIVAASADLIQTFHLTQDEIQQGLKSVSLKDTEASHLCPPEPTCPEFHFSYRTMDGTCNNIIRRDWGKAGRAFRRKLLPKYDDGFSELRKSVRGGALPSARLVSATISPPVSMPYENLTNFIWQWGQFLDHDITFTALSTLASGAGISCCTNGTRRPGRDLHPECRPIEIPANDPFYKQFRQRCMQFVRSMAAIPQGCTFDTRQQINQITSYIDSSNVYGSSDEQARSLRETVGGRLKIGVSQGRELLPPNLNDNSCASRTGERCFLSGDSRVNEQIDLTVMHTVWLRQHNKLAAELAKLNPGWKDEHLYQEAKRIVNAQMQHITYNEYLPIVLGRDFVESYGVLPRKEGYFRGYDEDIDATLFNVFSTAAFRYGHSLVTNTLHKVNAFGQTILENDLSSQQFSPFDLYREDTLDDLIRGLAKQKSEQADRFFSEQVTTKLFSGGGRFGMDLVALNIQRGRDHGLPPYVDWQEVCGLPRISSWPDLESRMSKQAADQLRSVYKDVDDIDLFIGGIAETTVRGSLLGPTFLCLVGQQFIALKIGDRFYYENGATDRSSIGDSGEPLSSFSADQLREIRKTSLARILCDNSNDIKTMQPLAFVTGHFANRRVPCTDGNTIPGINLEPWRNSRIWAKK